MAVTVGNPSTLALLLVGAVLFALGLIGFVARTRAIFVALSWGMMILGALVTLHAGNVSGVADRTTFALAAIVIALVEGGMWIAIAGRQAQAGQPEAPPAADGASHD